MRKAIMAAVAAILFAGSFAANAGEKTIGVTIMTREHVFFNIIEENLVKAAKDLGYKTIVMDANFDVNKQIGQIDDLITQKVDGMIIAPAATGGLEPVIKKLAAEKIPTVTVNIKINSDDPIIISSIGTDNYGGGYIAGEFAVKYLKGKGNTAVITYAEIFDCRERERGFKEAVAVAPGIKVLDTQNYAGSAEKAQQLVQDMLIKFPDLDLIFGVGDPAVVGGMAAAKAAGKDVKFIGFDGNPEAVDAIKQGGMWIADATQSPDQMGKLSVQALDDFWKGKTPQKVIDIKCNLIDQVSLAGK